MRFSLAFLLHAIISLLFIIYRLFAADFIIDAAAAADTLPFRVFHIAAADAFALISLHAMLPPCHAALLHFMLLMLAAFAFAAVDYYLPDFRRCCLLLTLLLR